MNTLPFPSITAWARASNFQSRRFLSSQWFPDRATYAQTNSRAPSVVLNQIDDLWSPSTFHLARDRRSSCRILPCHLVAHAQAPSFLWSPPALKQATRAFRLAGDRIAIGAGGSLGASSNKRAGEISSFWEAGPTALS